MTPLSVYILTCDSEKYLSEIIAACNLVADEIVIVDSGSFDNTLKIAADAHCRIFFRTFVNFREQRQFALSKCKHTWVLSFDSDEIPSAELMQEILKMKTAGFTCDAYCIKRNWNVLGKNVHAMFPVVSPDYPIRLFNKEIVSFSEQSTIIHETPFGYKTLGKIEQPLTHFTFETKWELERKLRQYSDIAAKNMLLKNKTPQFVKMLFSPPWAFLKWYFLKGNWKDGFVGITLAAFAFRYTLLKYKKAKRFC